MRFTYEHARDLFVVSMSLAGFLVTYAVASAPSRPAERLGMRGLKRRRAIEQGGIFAQVEPLIRWTGARVSGLLGDGQRARLDRQLVLAGDYLGLTPEEYAGLHLLGALVGAMFGYTVGRVANTATGMFMLAGAALGAIVPTLEIQETAAERLKVINRRLPVVIDLMALSMSAGLDFPGAVRQVVEKSSTPDDPLIEELSRIMQELGLGKTRGQVLQDFAHRAPVASVEEFVGALKQAEERGNPVAEVLQIQAVVSRQRRTVNAEEAAAKAGVKIMGPLVLAFMCVMILIVSPMVLKMNNEKILD